MWRVVFSGRAAACSRACGPPGEAPASAARPAASHTPRRPPRAPRHLATPAAAMASNEDWLAIMRALMATARRRVRARRRRAARHRLRPRVRVPCVEPRRGRRARRAGLHDEGARYVVRAAPRCSGASTTNSSSCGPSGSNGPAAQVDRRGRVVHALPPQPPTRWIYTLARAANAWRIIDVVREGAHEDCGRCRARGRRVRNGAGPAARAEGGSETDDDADTVTNHISSTDLSSGMHPRCRGPGGLAAEAGP